jgi:hypothetical protein
MFVCFKQSINCHEAEEAQSDALARDHPPAEGTRAWEAAHQTVLLSNPTVEPQELQWCMMI